MRREQSTSLKGGSTIARAHSMWCLAASQCKSYVKDTLPDLYSSSLLITFDRFAMVRQESLMKEMKDSMLKNNEEYLNKEKARAIRESAEIEKSLKQLSISIGDEINKGSKRNLEQLLKGMQEQKASNEMLRKACEEALLKTDQIHNNIEQEIKNTKADNNSRAVAGLINIDGEVRNIKQNLSDTCAKGGSFAGAGIIRGLDLSIPSSRNG